METFLTDAFQISILLNPFAVLSTFMALTGKENVQERAAILLHSCLAAAAAGLVVLFSGNLFFKLLDIDLNLFKAGGGAVLMICSISLVWGKEQRIRNCDSADRSIAVVPLAVPMAVGPGTAAGLIVIGSEHGTGIMQCLGNIAALSVGIAVLGAVLSIGVWSTRLLNRTAISVITRLSGLFLSAIAAKMILEGVRNFLHLP